MRGGDADAGGVAAEERRVSCLTARVSCLADSWCTVKWRGKNEVRQWWEMRSVSSEVHVDQYFVGFSGDHADGSGLMRMWSFI